MTTTGDAVTAAISPDGKEFVYVLLQDNKQTLRLKQIEGSNDTELVGPMDANYKGLTFSPDGNFIFYVRSQGKVAGTIYRMALRGGPTVTLYNGVDGPVSVSADGKTLAYTRDYPDEKQSAVVVGQADGSGERIAAVLKEPVDAFVLSTGPAFSPNGRLVAVAARHTDTSGPYFNVLVVGLRDGTVRPIGPSRFSEVGRIFWHSIGGTLMLTATDQKSRNAQVWQLGYPDGELTRVTNDSINYEDVTLSRDSHRILAVETNALNHVAINYVVLLQAGEQ